MASRTHRVNVKRLERLGFALLRELGVNPAEPGVKGTPLRWARMWRDFIERPDDGPLTTFEHTAGSDQMVIVSGMRVWSVCEHHLLPFWCDVTVGYLPGRRILGLSKFWRIAHRAAAKPQVQERLVREVADAVKAATGSPDVAVLAVGEHLCMTMRGVKTPARMTSSVMDGRFRELGTARGEFLTLATRSAVAP